jgi:hypothetical protein
LSSRAQPRDLQCALVAPRLPITAPVSATERNQTPAGSRPAHSSPSKAATYPPLSSRAQPRDLQCALVAPRLPITAPVSATERNQTPAGSRPAHISHSKAATYPPFVIPSAAEGSAVCPDRSTPSHNSSCIGHRAEPNSSREAGGPGLAFETWV